MGPSASAILWAQATGASATGTTVPPSSLAPLALRRWLDSLTLSSPEAVPSLYGLWAWLLGLAALMVVAVLFQGPGRAIGQVFDVAGHVRLARESMARLRRAGRMVALMIGITVLGWTLGQMASYNDPQGRDDLALLMKSRGLGELAIEQGIMAALTPLRDLAGLADRPLLVLIATVVVFRAASERWNSEAAPVFATRPPVSGWYHAIWGSGALLLLYYHVMRAVARSNLPIGGCLLIDPVVVPILVVICDGALLAYILVELRNAGLDAAGSESIDAAQVVGLMPSASLACLAALPARAVALAVLLGMFYVPDWAAASALGRYLRWQLNWGLADLQGAGLVLVGLAGAVAWGRGTAGSAFVVYGRMLRSEGGRLVVVLALSGLGCGGLSALAYLVVLSLPASTWVLAAADSYAHYATLPVGLWTLAALVELGGRSLPEATLAGPPAERFGTDA